MQQQDICDPIIDKVYDRLKQNGVFIGEIYTHLGRDPEDRDSIVKGAQELLKFIEEN